VGEPHRLTFCEKPAHRVTADRVRSQSWRRRRNTLGPCRACRRVDGSPAGGERRFASIVQLLETANGERLVRFAYSTDGTARRGPVTFRQRDVERPRAGLAKRPDSRRRSGYRRASARSRAASTSEARMSAPSAEPSSGSTACPMGHEAHDVPLLVADAGDVVDGTVAPAVAQDDLTVRPRACARARAVRTTGRRRA
jgi:hypothetical protein